MDLLCEYLGFNFKRTASSSHIVKEKNKSLCPNLPALFNLLRIKTKAVQGTTKALKRAAMKLKLRPK